MSIENRKTRIAKLSDVDLQKKLYAALYGHCVSEMELCQGSVDRLSPQEHQRVIAVYGEAEAWRWCATDDLQNLIDCMNQLIARAGGSPSPAPVRTDEPDPIKSADGVNE